MKNIDMTGKIFGRLTVLRKVEAKEGRSMWLCYCTCGIEKPIAGKQLRAGKVTSCGCKRAEGPKATYEDYSKRRKELRQINPDVAKRAAKKYRDKNLDAVRAVSKKQAAVYRRKASGVTLSEALKNEADFWGRVDVRGQDDCWMWKGPTVGMGYGVIAPMPGVLLRAHRVSFELTNGPIAEGLMVCHHCDTPGCVNPTHLFLGTAKDNNDDKAQKGRSNAPKGEATGNSKLTDEIVASIYFDSRTNREIGADYSVSPSLISMIRRKKVWAHVTKDFPDLPPRAKRALPSNLQALSA